LVDDACLRILAEAGIVVVEPWWKGDLIVGLTQHKVDFARKIMPWKRYLIYTDDPRFDRTPHDHYPRWGYAPPIRVLNPYSEALFWDNYGFVGM